MIASMSDYIDLVRLLLENDADPNIRNSNGESAYELALSYGNTDIAELIKYYIDLQRLQQNLAFATSMMSRSEYDIPLRHLDYDTFSKLIRYSRPDIQGVKLRMIDEKRRDPLTKSKQRLSTIKGIRDNHSVLQYLDAEMMRNIDSYLSSMRPEPSVQSRMMLEDENERIADYLNTLEQYGSGKHSSKRKKKKTKNKK
jgi:hypothetical protein